MALIDVKQINFSAVDKDITFSGAGNTIILDGSYSPSAANEVANKGYVDSVAAGLDPKESCTFGTLTDISGTYNSSGGTGGTGEFTNVDLTSGVIFDLNGDTVAIGDRILVKNQSSNTQNGIYEVTTAGATGVIERASDQDGSPSNEVSSGNFTFVENGASLASSGWVLTGDGVLTLNTDAIVWTQFSDAAALTAGNGIDISANVVSVQADGTTGGNIQPVNVVANGVGLDVNAIAGTGIEADGSANLRLATQGNGIAGGAGSTLSVDPDSESGGNIEPVTVGANGVGLDVSSIAGTGVEADGSANLRLAAQGNGIAGGAGSTLSVDPDSETGGDTQPVSVTANGVGLDVSAIAGAGLTADGSANLDVDGTEATMKKPVRAATTAAQVLASDFENGDTIDGVVLATGDRVLIKDQGTGSENGIYIVQATGAPVRAADLPSGNEAHQILVPVAEGTANGDKVFRETSDVNAATVGTDALSFSEFGSGGAGALAGDGLVQNGSALDVDPDSETGGNLQPVNVTANGVSLDINAVAGTGLEADGAANLRLATQGNGIAGGAGSTLSVDPDSETGGNIQPVSVGANGVGLDVSAIAGTGLEADGSANLRLATQGDGLTGGGGSTLSVLANGDSIDVSASGVKSAVPTLNDKNETPAAASSGQSTTVAIAATPGGNSYVHVMMNGLVYNVGDGVTTSDFYFRDSGNTTTRNIADIVATDVLYVGSGLGFSVETSDRISLIYDQII